MAANIKCEFVKKKGATSWVWNHFNIKTTIVDGKEKIDMNTVYCGIKDCVWKGNYATQTPNMANHIKKQHPETHKEEMNKKDNASMPPPPPKKKKKKNKNKK